MQLLLLHTLLFIVNTLLPLPIYHIFFKELYFMGEGFGSIRCRIDSSMLIKPHIIFAFYQSIQSNIIKYMIYIYKKKEKKRHTCSLFLLLWYSREHDIFR